MKPVIERTPVVAACPNGHTWNSEILPGSTMPQTASCPQCDMLVAWYLSLKETAKPQRIKRITSHVGVGRFLDTCKATNRRIPRIREIPSPHSFGPDHVLYVDSRGRDVFIVETAHKQYDVFLSPYSAVGKWSPIELSMVANPKYAQKENQ